MQTEPYKVGDVVKFIGNINDPQDLGRVGYVAKYMDTLVGQTFTIRQVIPPLSDRAVYRYAFEECVYNYNYSHYWLEPVEEVRNGLVLRLIKLRSGVRAKRWVRPDNPNIITNKKLQDEALAEALTVAAAGADPDVYEGGVTYSQDRLTNCCGSVLVQAGSPKWLSPPKIGTIIGPKRVEYLRPLVEQRLKEQKCFLTYYKDRPEHLRQTKSIIQTLESLLKPCVITPDMARQLVTVTRTGSASFPTVRPTGTVVSTMDPRDKSYNRFGSIWYKCNQAPPDGGWIAPKYEPAPEDQLDRDKKFVKSDDINQPEKGLAYRGAYGFFQNILTDDGKRFHFYYGCGAYDTPNTVASLVAQYPAIHVGDTVAMILTDRQIDDDKSRRLAAAGFTRLLVTGNINHSASRLYLYARIVTEDDKKIDG